jgi:D-aspartate ligase
MNLHYTGIGIGRSLHPLGIEVDGLSAEDDAPGARSRWFRRVHRVPHGRVAPQALCEKLLDIRRHYDDAPVIFPTGDADVLFLAEFAHQLAPHYRLPPGRDALPRLMDKASLASTAEHHHIETPKTAVCASEADVERVCRTLAFPVVIKPRSAHEWRKVGIWEQVGARKAIMAATPEALAAEYRRLAPVSPQILVQEFVPGEDSDIVVCCCYIDEQGELLGQFTARKLRQSPPLFGTGCLVEAGPVPHIVELSQRLLRACGYAGLAEVEFKHDAASGRHMLIEVNPRHWDQHQLGLQVGVNLSWIAYQKAAGHSPQPQAPVYACGSAPRWIAEREALMLLALNAAAGAVGSVSLLRIGARTVSGMMALLRRPFVLAVVSLRDPVPGLLLIARTVRELFVLARRRRRVNE